MYSAAISDIKGSSENNKLKYKATSKTLKAERQHKRKVTRTYVDWVLKGVVGWL